jgi:hypothetical protein
MYSQVIIMLSHIILSTVIVALAAATVMVTPHHSEITAAWAHQVVTQAIEIGPYAWLAIIFTAVALSVTNIGSTPAMKAVAVDSGSVRSGDKEA